MVKNPGIRYDNLMVARALEKGIPVWTEVELAYLVSEAPIIGIKAQMVRQQRQL